jgi:hypothetical protein
VAVEGGADDLLCLAVAVARREVEQGDAGIDRGVHGGDAFVDGGGAPQHAQATAAEGQDGDGRERTERVVLHGATVSQFGSPRQMRHGARTAHHAQRLSV